ncbi:MAG: NB-ARC domain-containing protein, partial [Bacteroidota bacterium]
MQWNHKKDYVSIPMQQDVRLTVDQLVNLAEAYPGLCNPTSLLPYLVSSTNRLAPPPLVPFFTGRGPLLKKINQIFDSATPRVVTPPITGPGGIGKSQLAVKAMAQLAVEHHYDHIFWISAETPEKLLEAYLRLAEDLRLQVDKKQPQKAVQDVRTHLQNKRCLYVFDDAPSREAIEEFLPLYCGHVLITSRNSNGKFWTADPIVVPPLSVPEVIELAQQHNYGKSEAERAAIESMLTHVPRYPLFLVQLFKMLTAKGINPGLLLDGLRNFSVSERDKKLLDWLSQNPYPEVGYDKGVSMFYILKTSLQKLFEEKRGSLATQLLSQLAYLDASEMPLELILKLSGLQNSLLHRNMRTVLSLLEKYSLVQWNRESQKVRMHPVTQRIVRHLHPQQKLTQLIDSLVAYADSIDTPHKKLETLPSLLPHSRTVYKRLDAIQYPQDALKL